MAMSPGRLALKTNDPKKPEVVIVPLLVNVFENTNG